MGRRTVPGPLLTLWWARIVNRPHAKPTLDKRSGSHLGIRHGSRAVAHQLQRWHEGNIYDRWVEWLLPAGDRLWLRYGKLLVAILNYSTSDVVSARSLSELAAITRYKLEPKMSGWFGLRKNSPKEPEGPQAVKALPASWYSSAAMYELERRAIFSKKWILVSHKARLRKSGQFLKITEAGFTFFLIKDLQGEIRGHHNVCRHRAYPLVQKDSGQVSILACKYHGRSTRFSYCGPF